MDSKLIISRTEVRSDLAAIEQQIEDADLV